MLLAIDTATRTCGLALHDGREILAEHTWQTPNHHTVELAPALRDMLERHALTPDDLTAIAAASGPGSYTGLRIGVALAKGLASARGLPLIGVTTLDIVAAAQPGGSHQLIAAAQAGRGRVIATTYQWRKARWKAKGEMAIFEWPTLIAMIDAPTMITGEIDADAQMAIDTARAEGKPITLATPAFRFRRAGFLAEEAWAKWREQPDGWTAAALHPIYVKTKDLP